VAEKKRKRRRRKSKKNQATFLKKAGKIAGIVLGVLVVIYLAAGFYFKSHFSPCTSINGVNVSGKTVAKTEKLIQKQLDDYVLTITDGDNNTEEVRATDINMKYVSDGSVKKLLSEQNSFLWLKTLLVGDKKDVAYSLEYDEETLDSLVADFACMKKEDVTEPVNAYPEYQDGQFVIVDEVYGSQVDSEEFASVIREKLESLTDTLVMRDEQCYEAPKYTASSEEVITACDKLNTYLQSSITYDMAGEKVEISKEDLASMLTCSDKMKATIDESKIKEYVQKLKDTYDTVGTKRTFTAGNGKTATVSGGDYGWSIDLDKEVSRLKKDIKRGEAVEREPKYSQEASTHDEADWGDTYIEIDLTNQHVYYFENGKVKLDTDVVTGNESENNGTPAGVYYIKYKQKDRTLRGPKQSDGSYKWESFVSYWMPFNGGIGLHDATWRSNFGGTIYKTNGSHGCVNVPPAKAGELYNYIDAGTPVVCHY
jgi:hypothetical protein